MNSEPEPNVVTEQELRSLAEEGQPVEVVCKAVPERRGPNWHGNWIMRTVSGDGRERHLVTARGRTSRGGFKLREFKTASGVISFLAGIGFSQAKIPLKQEQTTSHYMSET